MYEAAADAPRGRSPPSVVATRVLAEFSQAIKSSSALAPVNGHFPPLWAVVCSSQLISLEDTSYIFLLNHAKAIVSAAVRSAVLGPYAAQALLTSLWLRGTICNALHENSRKGAEDAGQCNPVLDLWVGRHELLYSRIFNS
ncbi:MAG: hypothetical protein MMC23_009627 [Stictis urceolatum]|nr:hypothetical protein [Stictis urceolata]